MIEKTTTPPYVGRRGTGIPFKTPAGWVDFPNDKTKQAQLEGMWNLQLNGFTDQGIAGNPWSATNVPVATNYYNPTMPMLGETVPTVTPIIWSPFPGRIKHYTNANPTELLSLADTGYMTDGHTTFPDIPVDTCPGGGSDTRKYGPYGPRGWQDEYCEWCITRNAAGKITRIDLTCENPEYFNTLWNVDPDQVVGIYREVLGKPQIQRSDLELPVTDPSTGQKAYNPLNKWNTGTNATATAGGAMHLTSTPNTIQTEIGLAATATPSRNGSQDFEDLICCAKYGQAFRNSDPNIGGSVNRLVRNLDKTATLTNPPGLYIQAPSDWIIFSTWDTNVKAEKFWKIVRGTSTLNDPDTGIALPGQFILHAVFEVPAETGHTVEDISINGAPIKYAGQLVQTLLMHILASALPLPAPKPIACVTFPSKFVPQPLQLFYLDVYTTMKKTPVPNPVGYAMNLLSNSTMIAPSIPRGTKNAKFMLIVDSDLPIIRNAPRSILTIDFGPGIVAEQILDMDVESVTYAIPGNSYPSAHYAVPISVTVDPNLLNALRSCTIKNDQSGGGQYPMPALLNVV